MKPIQEVIEALHRGEMGDSLGEASELHHMVVCDMMGPDAREARGVKPWTGLALYDPREDAFFFDSRHAGMSPEQALDFAADSQSRIIPYPSLGGVFLPLFDLVVICAGLGGRYATIGNMVLALSKLAREQIKANPSCLTEDKDDQ
jgi:hypothetical protein